MKDLKRLSGADAPEAGASTVSTPVSAAVFTPVSAAVYAPVSAACKRALLLVCVASAAGGQDGPHFSPSLPTYLPAQCQLSGADSAFFLREAGQDVMRNGSLSSRSEPFLLQRLEAGLSAPHALPSVNCSYGNMSAEQPVPLELLQGPQLSLGTSHVTLNWRVRGHIVLPKVGSARPWIQVRAQWYGLSGTGSVVRAQWYGLSGTDSVVRTQWYRLSGTDSVVRTQWYGLSGTDSVVRTQWYGLSGTVLVVRTQWYGLSGTDSVVRTQWYGLSGTDSVVWTQWYGLSGMDSVVRTQWYGLSGTDSVVRTQWYGLSGTDSVVWTQWYGLNGTASVVRTQWYRLSGTDSVVRTQWYGLSGTDSVVWTQWYRLSGTDSVVRAQWYGLSGPVQDLSGTSDHVSSPQVLFYLVGRRWDEPDPLPLDLLPCVRAVAVRDPSDSSPSAGCRLVGPSGLCVVRLEIPPAWFSPQHARRRPPAEATLPSLDVYYSIVPAEGPGPDCPAVVNEAWKSPNVGPLGGLGLGMGLGGSWSSLGEGGLQDMQKIGSVVMSVGPVSVKGDRLRLDENVEVLVPPSPVRLGKTVAFGVYMTTESAVEQFTLSLQRLMAVTFVYPGVTNANNSLMNIQQGTGDEEKEPQRRRSTREA
uniref:Uncharacterized protein n=1 Tax=Knipowitschia caucasica TaxID=637954 RepID=A0AAV2MN54_KNICA